MAKTASRKADAGGQQPDFEAALARLEEIVEKLDDGNLPLAQSLALFKEGTALAKRCRALLASAELAVKEALADVADDDMRRSGDRADDARHDDDEPFDEDEGDGA